MTTLDSSSAGQTAAKATPIVWVDAFAHRPFAGNQAAICLLHEVRPVEWMQALAVELNLSETAFVRPLEGGHFELRWFTPGGEIELCGHATLAAAHAMWAEFGLPELSNTITFDTLSGQLSAEREGERNITLNFPLVAPQAFPADIAPPSHKAILMALGLPESTLIRFIGKAGQKLFIELESAAAVRQCAPNFAAICDLPLRGILVTAESDQAQYQFVSRFFVPELGINEDPVTGSAHCSLAPYWASKLDRTVLTGYQASKRGGVVNVEVLTDGSKLNMSRVALTGTCHTIFKGELNESL